MICFNSFNLKGIIIKNLIELINDNIIKEYIGSTIILYFYLSACTGVKLSRFSVGYFALCLDIDTAQTSVSKTSYTEHVLLMGYKFITLQELFKKILSVFI
jgi:hypothetical protein